MRSVFERELKDIREGLATMSTQAVTATARAVNALVNRNFEEAREVKRDDKVTDQLRYEVENALSAGHGNPTTRGARCA